MKSENAIVHQLLSKGVQIPNPASIEIGPEVDPGRISAAGVVIHSGCKIFGCVDKSSGESFARVSYCRAA